MTTTVCIYHYFSLIVLSWVFVNNYDDNVVVVVIVESKTLEMIILIVLERKNFCIVNQYCYIDIDLIDYYDMLRKGSGRKRRRTSVSVINIETKNNEKRKKSMYQTMIIKRVHYPMKMVVITILSRRHDGCIIRVGVTTTTPTIVTYYRQYCSLYYHCLWDSNEDDDNFIYYQRCCHGSLPTIMAAALFLMKQRRRRGMLTMELIWSGLLAESQN